MKMNENKTNLIIVIVVIALVTMLTIFFIATGSKSKYSNITMLSINELKTKIENKDSFILIISRDDCSHCKTYLPTANKVGQEYNVMFYDISQTNLSEDNLTYLRNIANISGTPTTVFIEDGEEKQTTNRLVGDVKEYRIVEKLKAMGYINEE